MQMLKALVNKHRQSASRQTKMLIAKIDTKYIAQTISKTKTHRLELSLSVKTRKTLTMS